MAERIQLRRTRGWRKPEGAIVVARPSRWGNPFHVGEGSEAVNGGHPAGDCLRACVASIIGADLDDVPHFVQYVEHPHGTAR